MARHLVGPPDHERGKKHSSRCQNRSIATPAACGCSSRSVLQSRRRQGRLPNQVQARLADNGPRLQWIAATRQPSLLCGLVVDGLVRRMSPSHVHKGSKRYRYYITHADAVLDAAGHAWRVSAHDLERIVVPQLRTFLADGTAIHSAIAQHTIRVRRGHEIRLIVPSAEPRRSVERLVALIADAQAARSLMLASPPWSLEQIALVKSRCRTQLSRLIKLSYLAPDIVAMAIDGHQPASLTRRRLMATELPLAWSEQRTMLGC